MRAGVLIIGSLWWDECGGRADWRQKRLVVDEAMQANVALRYGRRSQSRGNTYTMVLSPSEDLGQALMVPFRKNISSIEDLVTEAECLWRAERPSAGRSTISATWGCVGALWRDGTVHPEIVRAWSNHFKQRGRAISPIAGNGILEITWPLLDGIGQTEIGAVLATATKPEEKPPTPEEVADAWADQDDGYEKYFFENIKHGIRTPDDVAIWQRVNERQASWLAHDRYPEAVAILRAESGV